MDVLGITRAYIKEMVTIAGPQMKVILMDKETTGIVSCAFTQSEMMQKEVYLFERLDSAGPRDAIRHLKCIVFVRPTQENVQLLTQELRNPKYAQYYIFFSNIISKTEVKALAEADDQETVRDVHEFFIDGIALSQYLFVLNQKSIYDNTYHLTTSAFLRIKQGLVALMLSMKKRGVIRYQRSSNDCKKLAEELGQVMRREESLFENNKHDTLLLIIDRSEDPVTPLLNQWTYEAMVHELIGINNNRVNLDGQGMVLSELHDDFYAQNITSNFGDLGQNIKVLINEFQAKSKIHTKLDSIADMKNFVEEYPQFKKISGTVSKHVALVGELSKLVGNRNLLEISEVEQSIWARGDHSWCLEKIRGLLNNPKITRIDAIRLVLLYALRFETHASQDIKGLITQLRSKDTSAGQYVTSLLRYAGTNRRSNDLFGQGSTMEMTKKFIKDLKGVENVYTQHEPFIKQIVDNLIRGRLSEQFYPYVTGEMGSFRQEHVIIFIVGGASFEESAYIRSMNEKRAQGSGGPGLILGTTYMHNTSSFIEQFTDTR